MTTTFAYRHEALDGLEARFGLRVASALTAQGTSHDVSERLRVAREQALATAVASRRATTLATAPQVVSVSAHGAALMGPGAPWSLRLGALLPLIVLVFGLFAIDQWHSRVQINAAAEVDAALLSDDIPPAAYDDPGFAEFLKSPAATE
jgi:hypothetical protein